MHVKLTRVSLDSTLKKTIKSSPGSDTIKYRSHSQAPRGREVKPLCFLGYFEPRHDKTNNVAVRPAKTQISLGIRPV